MEPGRVSEPSVLIVSRGSKHISKHIGRQCARSGAVVTIADINLREHRVVIKNLNKQGVKYASITREVCNDEEACDVLFYYLNDCPKFDLVINLANEGDAVTNKLTDILVQDGGILYTLNKLDIQIYSDVLHPGL